MGLFNKIKSVFSKDKDIVKYDEALTKTRKEFSTKISDLSKKYKNIGEDYFEELEDILIMADIGINTVMKFVDKLKKRAKEENIKDTDTLKEIIVDEMLIMYVDNKVLNTKIKYSEEGPTVILFVGVNGVGKTTSIGKIANRMKNAGKKVIAVTRLEKYGEHINDHQIQNNEAFSSNRYVLMADLELENLGECFQKIYDGTDDIIPWENKDPLAIVKLIDNFIQENW